MTTTTSFSNWNRFLSMYRQDLRRVRSLTLFYWTLSFLFFPLQFLLEVIHAGPQRGNPAFSYSYALGGPGNIYNVAAYLIFFPLTILMSIVVASQLMSYLQNKRAVDVYHALPVSREQMMGAHFAAGMTAIGLPLLLNFIFVLLVKALFGISMGAAEVGLELVFWLITVFVIFSITAFAAVNVGTVFDTVIFSIFLNGILPCVYLMCVGIFSQYLYGYMANLEPLLNMSPVILLALNQASENISLDHFGGSSSFILVWFGIWLLIGAAILALTLFLYKRRRSEMAESVSTSRPLQLVAKLSCTFLGSLLIGLLFMGIFDNGMVGEAGIYNNRYFIGGTVIGAFVAFLVIEVVLARGFKTIKRSIPALLVCMAFMAFFTANVCTGGFGFANNIPKLSDVQAVSINYRGIGADSSLYEITGNHGGSYTSNGPETITLTSDAAKEIVLRLHQAQLDEWNAGAVVDYNRIGNYYRRFTLDYDLGGLHLKRLYNTLSPKTAEILMELEACPEFIEKTTPLLAAKPENIQRVRYFNALGEEGGTLELTNEATQRLLDAVKSDLFGQTATSLDSSSGIARGYLKFEVQGFPPVVDTDDFQRLKMAFVQSTILISSEFTNTIAFLGSQNVDFGVDLTEYDMMGVYLQDFTVGGYNSVVNQTSLDTPAYYHDLLYQRGLITSTSDPQVMTELLSLAQSRIRPTEPYIVLGLYRKEDSGTSGSTEEPVPPPDEAQPNTAAQDESGKHQNAELKNTLQDEVGSVEPKETERIERTADCILFMPIRKAPDYLLDYLLGVYIDSDPTVYNWLTEIQDERHSAE